MSPRISRARERAGLLLILLVMLASGGCGDSPTAPDAPLRQQVTLAPGEAVSIVGSSSSLRFVGVEGDSRCPADAMCVLGGDAQVVIEITDGRTRQRYELHTGDMQPVRHDGLTVALVRLSPYPFSGQPIQPTDYRATMAIAR